MLAILQSILQINCSLETITKLVKLRINSNPNTEIKLNLEYISNEKTLIITDEMEKMISSIELEELFSSQEEKLKQLNNFEYIDSNRKYSKETEYTFEINELKNKETKIKFIWNENTDQHISGKSIETILKNDILAPENQKYKIILKDINKETETVTPINLFELKTNKEELKEYLEKSGKLNQWLETITLDIKIATESGKEYDSKTYIFITEKDPLAPFLGRLPEKICFFNNSKINFPNIELFKNFLIVSKINCPEKELIDTKKFENDLLIQTIKQLENSKDEILNIIQEEVLQMLLKYKMTGSTTLVNELLKVFLINYYELNEIKTLKFPEFIKKYKDVETLFSVLPNQLRNNHPQFENITSPIIIASTVIHEQIFLNSQIEKMKNIFDRQPDYITDVSADKLELANFISFILKQEVKYTNRLLINPLNVTRIEKLSSTLLSLINPIGGTMNMFYSSRSLIELSNNEIINEYLSLFKTNKVQLILDIIDLYISSCILTRVELSDNMADLQLISFKARRDESIIIDLLNKYEEHIKQQKEGEANQSAETNNTDNAEVVEEEEKKEL